MGSLKDYQVLNKIGQGSFGTVFRIKNRKDKREYVLKQINLLKMDAKSKACALAEGKILRQINSRYIVTYEDSFVEKNFLNIIMQYCSEGDLAHYLKSMMGRALKEDQIWRFFIQMVIGIADLHMKKILHRDIKSLNIFLTSNGEIRIGDLGVAKEMKTDFAQTIVGTPYYLSPEMCQQKPYNEKTDIWALGCILYELCTGKYPFDANNQAALALKIIMGKYKPIPQTYSKNLSQLVAMCLSTDHKRRPTARHILAKQIVLKKIQELNIQTQPRGVLDIPQQILVKKQQQKTVSKSKSNSSRSEDPKQSGPKQELKIQKVSKPSIPVPVSRKVKDIVSPPKKTQQPAVKGIKDGPKINLEIDFAKKSKPQPVQPVKIPAKRYKQIQQLMPMRAPDIMVTRTNAKQQELPTVSDLSDVTKENKLIRVVAKIQQYVDDDELEKEFGVMRKDNVLSCKFRTTSQALTEESSISHPVCNMGEDGDIPELLEQNQLFQDDQVPFQQDNIYLIDDKQEQLDQNALFLTRKLQQNQRREIELRSLISMKQEQILKTLPREQYLKIKTVALKADEQEILKVVNTKGLWKSSVLVYAFYKVLQYQAQIQDCLSRIMEIKKKIEQARTSNGGRLH